MQGDAHGNGKWGESSEPYLEALELPPIGLPVDLHPLDPAACRAPAQGLDGGFHVGPRAFEDRCDRAVRQVLHPAGEVQGAGGAVGEIVQCIVSSA
jgi:hypothetical protein